MGSLVPKNRLAEYPPATPLKAAAKPAIGCLLNDKKTMAPSGTKTTYSTEAAIFDNIPSNTIVGVMSDFVSLSTDFWIYAPRKSVFSDTPYTIMATNTSLISTYTV